MATVADMMDALASKISTALASAVPNLQVDGRMIPSPTPPSIDVYPGDPFQTAMAFGLGNNDFYFLVRARVDTADNEAGQDLLLSMMDPSDTTSVAQAIGYGVLGSTDFRVASIEGPSGFSIFPYSLGPPGSQLLGCTWTVRVVS